MSSQSPFSLPQPTATTCLVSILTAIKFLDILHTWNHTKCDLLCLAYFVSQHVFEVHPSCSMYKKFIPFYCLIIFHYGHNTFCLSVYQLMNIQGISTSWLLNNAVTDINIRVQIFVWPGFPFSWVYT